MLELDEESVSRSWEAYTKLSRALMDEMNVHPKDLLMATVFEAYRLADAMRPGGLPRERVLELLDSVHETMISCN